ncbi:MAG TPA: ParA family protein [Anaerolineales bacterium]|nr:ParA family protein [Anaerolineales bacterium]HRQ92064.1 ParA family protein [Anaerolineales bacterium]
MARIYTLVNQKGGVGKTTTSINLGAYLAHFGQRVLLVDLDPQANATSCLGIDKTTVKSGTYEAIMGLRSAAESILVSPELKLSLLPASPALAGAEVELVNELARENRLREALAPLKDKYDYILIDCPPSLGLLTLNGMVAAQDGIIIPVQCEYLALEGLSMLLSTIERVRKALFPGLKLRGVLLTMYDNRTRLSDEVVSQVRSHFKNEAFKAIIPRNIRLAEAPSHGLPIIAYFPNSPGAEAHRELALEVLEGDGVNVAVTA